MVVSLGAFDPHPYRILLAEEIDSMFTKREHSYFVVDFIWRQDNVAGICQQCTMDLTRSLRQTLNLQPYQLGVVAENS